MGGEDPKSNPRLRLVIQKAKAANVPNENIDRNIKKAMNPDTEDYVEVVYEIYGHGGVGVIVEAMTDNKNRTASEMRIATNKRGGNSAEPGSVSYNFDRKGVIQIPKSSGDEERVMEAAIDAGAEDFEASDDLYMVTTDPTELFAVKEKLEGEGIAIDEADIEMIPKHLVECNEETKQANEALIDWLEELEDVNHVYHNME
ncbi:MAG: putative transcriptional regulatory protein [Chlamydiales bacterium]|nr:putative transcriptional regulatory protein [Chlamydiales bacterium]MCH9619345.1 putative transcriptional regulatory protein [Chlamydiales bacterium]MCH9622149.1 putative transcriptional regulatory protein [Chlamydiales bacterium]